MTEAWAIGAVMIGRRELLNVTAGAVSALAAGPSWSSERQGPNFHIVDTNVSLFRWPFRRLPLDNTTSLVEKLGSLGVAEAWAGSYEAVLHRDIAGVNRRLAEECGRHRELTPIGSVNPALPDWADDLRRCAETHGMPGVRVYPNYHGYTLDDPRFARLMGLAAEAGLFVQLAAAMEDTRTQHPMVRVPDVDLSPLPGVLRGIPRAKVQVLNHRLGPPLLGRLAEVPGVHFDTARVEGTDGVPELIGGVPAGRVMFGTGAPFFIPEAALIRVHEAGLLGEAGLRSALAGNAGRFREVTRE